MAQEVVTKYIEPQEGPQTTFLSSGADIVIYGGAAGGGKTYAALLHPTRFLAVKGFSCQFFRRKTTEIDMPGGLWDESHNIYIHVGGEPKTKPYRWIFSENGSPVSKIVMNHLQYDSDVYSYQSSQIPCIIFEELTHFTYKQFFYLLSRNRSVCGVKPHIRATCNPDADSWVAGFIEWWVDQDTGYPIPERCGKIRWFFRYQEELFWADTEEGCYKLCEEMNIDPNEYRPKSLTFIAATIHDNKKLLEADPGYLANLMAQSRVERERLLGGNWKIRPASGLYFKRDMFTIVDTPPCDIVHTVRAWDLAATEKIEGNDPDATCGMKMSLLTDGRFLIHHQAWMQGSPARVERLLQSTAISDSDETIIGLSQDPGQAGKSQFRHLVKLLAGFVVRKVSERGGDKVMRASAFSAQCEAGNVLLLNGPWIEEYLGELEAFPEGGHDDRVDASSNAFNLLMKLSGKKVKVAKGISIKAEREEEPANSKPETITRGNKRIF